MGKRFFKASTWVQDPEFQRQRCQGNPNSSCWPAQCAGSWQGGREGKQEEGGLHDAPPARLVRSALSVCAAESVGTGGSPRTGLNHPPGRPDHNCFTRPPSAALHTRLQEQKPGQRAAQASRGTRPCSLPPTAPSLLPPAPVGPPPRTSRTQAKTKLQPAAAELAWIPPPPLPALAPRPRPRSQSLSFLTRTAGTIHSPLRTVVRFKFCETGDETWRHTAGHRVS